MFEVVRRIAPLAVLAGAMAHGLGVFYGLDAVGGDTAAPRPSCDSAYASFLLHVTDYAVDALETLTPGTDVPHSLNFGTLNSGTLSAVDHAVASTSLPAGGPFPESGSVYLWATGSYQNTITLALSQVASAFGVYCTDTCDADLGLGLTVNTVGAGSQTLAVRSYDGISGTILFFGVIAESPAEQFTSVQLVRLDPSEDDPYGLDSILVGTSGLTPVPEPATGLLFSGFLIASVLWQRRTRRRDP